jgi:p-cumate 2,3-dioxygenase alpha subunit
VSENSFVVEDVEGGTFRVHRKAVSDRAVAEREWAAIFDKVWLYLGHESELPEPGDYVARSVARRPIILSRDRSGELHALINSCMHRGAEVCRDPSGNTRAFRCFYHGWTYDTSGALVGVPGRPAYGPRFQPSDLGLRHVPRFESYRGFMFGSFNADVVPLEEYLGNARPYLDAIVDQSEAGMEVISGTHDYSIDANWKLLVENSIDGYHLQPLHVTYFQFLKDSGDDQMQSRRPTQAYDLGNGHAVLVDNAPWGRPVARWVPSFGEDAREAIEKRMERLVELHGEERAQRIGDDDVNLFLFPNLVINDVMAVVVRTIWPVGADRMEIRAWALGPKDDSEDLRAITLRSFVSFLGPGGFATPDDMEALESCQRGMGAMREVPWSDLSRGMNKTEGHLSSDEVQLRAFWRRWQHLLDADVTLSPS